MKKFEISSKHIGASKQDKRFRNVTFKETENYPEIQKENFNF